jgi:hypothetical protein
MLFQCDPPRKLTEQEAGWAAAEGRTTPHPHRHTHTRFCMPHTAAERSTPQRARASTQHSTAQHSTAHCQQQSSGAQQRAQQEIPKRAVVTATQEVCWVTPASSEPTPAVLPHSQSFQTRPAQLQTNQHGNRWPSAGSQMSPQLVRCWQWYTQAEAESQCSLGTRKEPTGSKSTHAAAHACCSTPHTSGHPAGQPKELLLLLLSLLPGRCAAAAFIAACVSFSAPAGPPSNLPPLPTGSKWTRMCARNAPRKRNKNKCDRQSCIIEHGPLPEPVGGAHVACGTFESDSACMCVETHRESNTQDPMLNSA